MDPIRGAAAQPTQQAGGQQDPQQAQGAGGDGQAQQQMAQLFAQVLANTVFKQVLDVGMENAQAE